jgi:anti-sigma factor RsiW
VKTPEPPHNTEHPKDLLLQYLDDTLSPEQKLEFERHIDACSTCAMELEDLAKITGALRENKEIYCPDSLEIEEFVRENRDPAGRITAHLEVCPACSAFAESLQQEGYAREMPLELWHGIQERLEVPADKGSTRVQPQPEAGLLERFFNRFRIPSFAAAALVAAALLVIVVLPRDTTSPLVGLSSVAWENAPKPKVMRPRAAFLVTFPSTTQHLSQKKVDSIYAALQPDLNLLEKYEIVPPSELKSAAQSGQVTINPEQPKEMFESLNSKLGVSIVSLVQVSRTDGLFRIKVDVVDTQKGSTIQENTRSGISEEALPQAIREMVFATLQP